MFHLSPLPTWVYDCETLQFLDVNGAAIQHYGYSLDEFLSMTIKDIRNAEELALLEQYLAKNLTSGMHRGVFKHRKEDGTVIQVDIQSNSLIFNGRNAKIIIATDVTESMNYLKTIEYQNKQLREIAWVQSHIVRAPLAKIMGLVELIRNKFLSAEELENVIGYITVSADELDAVIRDISNKTSETGL